MDGISIEVDIGPIKRHLPFPFNYKHRRLPNPLAIIPISFNTQAPILFLLKIIPSCPLPGNVAVTGFSSHSLKGDAEERPLDLVDVLRGYKFPKAAELGVGRAAD